MKKFILTVLFLGCSIIAFAQYTSSYCFNQANQCDRWAQTHERDARNAMTWAKSYYGDAQRANNPSHYISKAQSYEREASNHQYKAQQYRQQANEWRQKGYDLQRQGK
jgi:hypothetical protein